MREFKFRVWENVESEMNYDCIVSDNFIIFNYTGDCEDDLFTGDVDFVHLCELNRKYFTIMQYTGIRDMIGKEIYEGDIVRDKYNKIGYVSFLKQELGFCVVYKDFDCRLGHRNTGSCYNIDTNIEVIGNIYENKDLLEW